MGGETDERAGTSASGEAIPEFLPPTAEPSLQTPESGLKYLEFLRLAIINGSIYALTLYNYGKENSGPLKASVNSVEDTVRTLTGPLAYHVEGKLPGLLQFADKKVDDTIQYLDVMLPPNVKERSFQAYDVARDAAKQAPDAARSVAVRVQEQGVCTTASDYYTKIQPLAKSYGSQAWQTLVSLPLSQQAGATARIGADRVKQMLLNLKDSRFPLSAYVPLIPLDNLDRSSEEQEQEQFRVR